jgi:hypothetical protein
VPFKQCEFPKSLNDSLITPYVSPSMQSSADPSSQLGAIDKSELAANLPRVQVLARQMLGCDHLAADAVQGWSYMSTADSATTEWRKD